MKTILPTLIVLAAVSPLPLCAQSPVEPAKVIKITLHPMAQPRPALKYRLLPSFLDCRPGNAAVMWNRLPAERTAYFHDLDKLWETTDQWMEIPINDPREKEFRAKHPEICSVGDLYADMARAARYESCDWQLPIHEGNAFQILLPELNQLRTFGRLLAAKARLEIAEGKYDQAVETLQTGLALARDAAKGPTLIHGLVGAAIAGPRILASQIEQFIQRPDAPNLYWALSALPRPLIDFRPGFEAESNSLFLQFPELRDLDKKDLSAEDWRKLLGTMFNATERLQRQPEAQSLAQRRDNGPRTARLSHGEAVSHRARPARRGSGGNARGQSRPHLQRGDLSGAFRGKFQGDVPALRRGQEVVVARRSVCESIRDTGKSCPLPR